MIASTGICVFMRNPFCGLFVFNVQVRWQVTPSSRRTFWMDLQGGMRTGLWQQQQMSSSHILIIIFCAMLSILLQRRLWARKSSHMLGQESTLVDNYLFFFSYNYSHVYTYNFSTEL